MTKDEKKKRCRGCHNDYYNQPGNSGTGECWMLDSAKPVRRTRVGTWQNPPYHWAPQATLDCHRPNGSHWIDKDDQRIQKAK